MNEKTTENPRAFVRFADYQIVIQSLRSMLRIQSGDATVRKSKGTSIRFLTPISERAFSARGTATSIRLNAGFVSFASRQYYFPAATYQGASGGGVFLRVNCNFNASAVYDGPDEKPWSCTIVETQAPTITWRSLSSLGAHARIRNPPDTPDIGIENYTLEVDAGVVYVPIAAWNGAEVANIIRGNITLTFDDTGRLFYESYGLI